MLIRIYAIIALLLIGMPAFASQSKVVTATGKACMGEDRSKKQTEDLALIDAKRQALEYTLTHVKSETKVKNYQLEKDLVDAYANASIRILEEMSGAWSRDMSAGDCFKRVIKAEVIPEELKIQSMVQTVTVADDPNLPLGVKVWTDKVRYRNKEKIKIFIRANKHFYARVIYRNVAGEVVQLLPNPFRKNNFMSSSVIHELPSKDDRFDIEVIPPFGTEIITVFASTSQLGELDLQEASTVYKVKTSVEDIAVKTRGVALTGKTVNNEDNVADFAEAKVIVETVNP